MKREQSNLIYVLNVRLFLFNQNQLLSTLYHPILFHPGMLYVFLLSPFFFFNIHQKDHGISQRLHQCFIVIIEQWVNAMMDTNWASSNFEQYPAFFRLFLEYRFISRINNNKHYSFFSGNFSLTMRHAGLERQSDLTKVC